MTKKTGLQVYLEGVHKTDVDVVRDGQGRVSYYLVGDGVSRSRYIPYSWGDAQTQGHNMSNKYQPHELHKRIVKGKVKFFK